MLVDTNVILSAILFRGGAAAAAFAAVVESHQLVLSDHTIQELQEVFEPKFPDKSPALGSFIDALMYQAVIPQHALPRVTFSRIYTSTIF